MTNTYMTSKISYRRKQILSSILGSFLISVFIFSPFGDVVASSLVNADTSSETASDVSESVSASDVSIGQKTSVSNGSVAVDPVQAAPTQSGTSGNRFARLAQTVPLALSVALEVHPNYKQIPLHGYSILVWVSHSAVSCSSSDFNTRGATSGIVSVQPPITTVGGSFTYSITCVDTFGNTVSDSDTVTATRTEGHIVTAVQACPVQTDPTTTTNTVINTSPVGNDIPRSVQSAPIPMSVYIQAVPSGIELGGQSMLVWYAPDAVSCSSSDFNTHGTNIWATSVLPPITAVGGTHTYSVNCVNASGHTVNNSVTITANRPASPTLPLSVNLEAVSEQIELGGYSLLVWVSHSAVSCSSSDFNTRGATSGFAPIRPSISALGGTQTYSINCVSASGQTVNNSVTITANRIAPTHAVQNCAVPPIIVTNNNQVSVSLTANPTEIQVGGSSTLTWASQNAVSCTSNTLSGNTTTHAVPLNGSVSVTPAITVGQSITYSVTCTDAENANATALATVTAVSAPGGGGNSGGGNGGGSNGGNSGGSGSNGGRNNGSVLGASTGPINSCSYSRDFLRMDWENDPAEVTKLQSFLKDNQKLDVDVNGIFDQKTFAAVSAFQEKYKSDVLTPWGHTDATGFVYILTKKKINEIYCNTTIALSVADKQEIDSFRNYLLSVLSTNSNSVNPVGGSLEEANISVWGIESEDIDSNDESDLSENSSEEETSNEDQATSDVSKSGGFWNYVKGLFGSN